MITFEEIDNRLTKIGKDRAWLADVTGRSPSSVRAALAPNAPPGKRSALLQKALSDAIEAEEAEQGRLAKLPPGWSAIFLSLEELELADKASRLVGSPSVTSFCHDVIQAEARRVVFGLGDNLIQLPKAQESPYWLDLVGGIAAGAPISSDVPPAPIPSPREYGADHYALRVFGRSMEPKVRDGSTIVVRRLPDGHTPKKGNLVVYSDGHGLALKELAYRKARADEEGDNLGRVAVLRSINPEFPEVQTMEGGRVEAVFVETL